ncbi:MAG: DUF1501 domain-containing protein [Gemmataceae bacterium]|nr:DUF1501 domain-containing protein [Gemmataceae bacterium]
MKNISHPHAHSFSFLNPLEREGLVVSSRRNFLKAGVAGIGGLTLPGLLKAKEAGQATGNKAIILLWMTGGPSQIDTWDPKPGRPLQNRGPFQTIATKLPGVRICEHLPKQASMLDRITLIRSIDPKGSNHEPNTVFQTGNRLAEPRVNPLARHYPAIGSILAKHHGANHPAMPPYVTFARSRSHIAYSGYLGKQYDPFPGEKAARLPIYSLIGEDSGNYSAGELFRLHKDINLDRVQERSTLLQQMDSLRKDLDITGNFDAMDRFNKQAVEILAGSRARNAFDWEREPQSVRDRYGSHLWCRQALLARRLVEAGVSFVTIDLSYHTASGTWDNHGDNIPPYGGISKGLKPLLPLFDHLFTTLIEDLEQRGMIDDVLVVAMGEFGRTPQMGTQGSTDGRNHWTEIMSMALAGGGLTHGQVIGASEADGGTIKERPILPGDLAATFYRHMGIPLDTTYADPSGRPHFVVDHGGPIRELF